MPIIDQLIAYIANIFEAVGNNLLSTINGLKTWVQTVFLEIKNFIFGLGESIKALFTNLMAMLNSTITAIMTQLTNALQTIINAIWEIIGPTITAIKGYILSAMNTIIDVGKGMINQIAYFVGNVVENLSAWIKDVTAPVIQWFADKASAIGALIDSVIADLQAGWNEFVSFIRQSYEDLLGGSNSLIETIGQRLSNVAEGFSAAAETLGTKIGEVGTEIFGDLKTQIESLIKPFESMADPETMTTVKEALFDALSPNSLKLQSRAEAQAFASRIMPNDPVSRWIFLSALAPALLLRVYSGVADANAQIVLQEFAQSYHYQLLAPADATLAVFRGDLTRQEAKAMIVRQGYSPEHADMLLNSGNALPPVGDLLSMRLRKIIPEETFTQLMVQHGFSNSQENAYVKMSEVIPPVSDLIQMAVKGAFSPDEVAAFRTDEDFPEAIVEHAKSQGLSDEWMKAYWRAHWNLPSPTQGFEMFQRQIIGPERLDTLLKALDIMPGWRDDLVKLSYNTLGRVDIRRIHQLGLMSHDEVVKAHRDLGYSPEDAERLTVFTEELNKGKPGEADEELGRLSRTNVINFYQDGVIDRPRTIDLLVKIGFTKEAATLFVDTADFEAERVTRQANIDFILANAQAGVITFEQAQDQLGELHLSPTELDRASTKLIREQTRATKLPTVDQGTKMFQAKAISEDQFRDLLRRLGYRAEWTNAFVTIAKTPDTKAKA